MIFVIKSVRTRPTYCIKKIRKSTYVLGELSEYVSQGEICENYTGKENDDRLATFLSEVTEHEQLRHVRQAFTPILLQQVVHEVL